MWGGAVQVACRGCRILAFGEHGRELGAEGYCSWCIGRRAVEGEMTAEGRERLRRFRRHGDQGERSRTSILTRATFPPNGLKARFALMDGN